MMTKEIRQELSRFSNGGNSFLVLSFLYEKAEDIIEISQEELAQELNKTRPSIKKSLDLLTKLNLIEISYGKIIIKKSVGAKNV